MKSLEMSHHDYDTDSIKNFRFIPNSRFHITRCPPSRLFKNDLKFERVSAKRESLADKIPSCIIV